MVEVIVRILLLGIALMLLLAASTTARTLESLEDGRWEKIAWYPSGMPGTDDTVLIMNTVTDVPATAVGLVVIRGGGYLTVSGDATFGGLVNRGTLTIEGGNLLQVAGDVLNEGSIGGDGTLLMTADGSTIAGSRPFTHLLVAGSSGTTVYLAGSITLLSIWLGEENRLDAGAYNLVVNGPYSSNSAYSRPGIIGGDGVISLNGDVYGSASGRIRIGSVPGARVSRRAAPPALYGVLGDPSGGVTFAASRVITSCVLMGEIVVDSEVTVQADGVGPDGRVRVFGQITNRGTLRATDIAYRWTVDSVLINTGLVDGCTVEMTGYRPTLTSSGGEWSGNTNLIYTGTSGGRLDVNGVRVVSKLTVAPAGIGDSDIVLQLNDGPLRIRHEYNSSIASDCRLLSDTTVNVWGRAHGIIEADVRFEGFWGSAIGGRFGRDSAGVRLMYPKRIDQSFSAREHLTTDPTGRLTVAAPATVEGSATVGGLLVFENGAVMGVDGNLELRRGAGGSGMLLIRDTATLDVRDTIGAGLALEIGDSAHTAQVMLTRTLRAPKLTIHQGSGLKYNSGDSVSIGREFVYDVLMQSGYSITSVAADPFASAVDSSFPGRSSSLYRFNGGYVATNTVQVGEGYYVQFPAPTTVHHRGRFINAPITIPIIAGWNLIGTASIPIRVADIAVSGTTLTSGFSTQQGSSTTVSVLVPGRGYWVQSAGIGSLTLNAPTAPLVKKRELRSEK